MSDRNTTWWTVKFIDLTYRPPQEVRGGAAYAHRRAAEGDAHRFRQMGAKNVRVVPCDVPGLRTPLKPPPIRYAPRGK